MRITDITANATGSTSFNTSPFSPGITTTVSGGVAKRWLTPGPTPSGWHSPGPACTITNNFGKTQGVFVEIDGVKRASTTFEDSSTSYDPTNGGTSYPGSTACETSSGGTSTTCNDFTFNVWDPAIVSNYGTSCTSTTDPTCYGRIHMEMDHDWQAAKYCGSGTTCDPNAFTSQTTDGVTLIDFQGFVYWDPVNTGAQDHSFSGWELHPLTGWRIHQSAPTASFSFSPASPVAGQAVTFTGAASGGTSPYTFAWNFGDGVTTTGNPATHTYSASGSYTVTLTVTDSLGAVGTGTQTVTVVPGSTSDFSISSSPTSLTIQPGSSGTSTINLASLNSFSGTVSLSPTVSPSGLTVSLNPTSVSLSSGGSASSTLTASSSTPGSYAVTVMGTSGSLSHTTTVAVTVTSPTSTVVASDSAVGPSSLATEGGQKLIQDPAGKMIAVYVDSSGRIGLAYANSDPVSGGWSVPVKSAIPTSAYNWPAAVLLSLTSLQIIAAGGSSAGVVTDIPVTVQRDSQNNITGVSFGTPTILDSSGLDKYPAAVLAHNRDVLLAWGYANSTRSEVKSLRWDPATGWTNFAGTSNLPDIVLVDSTNLAYLTPSIIERPDNDNVYLMANRFPGPPSTIAFNKATWNGSAWSWGTQNLTYESNASDADDDFVSLAWDPVRSLVVASYGITGTFTYGVFTLNAQDVKTHMDTPALAVAGDRGWGGIAVHTTTGDYYLFLVSVNTDAGSGPLGYIRMPAGGTWNATINWLNTATDNQVLSLRPTGSSPTLDLLYAEGTSAPVSVKFTRISPVNPPNFSLTASPSTLTILAGSSVTSTITLTSLSGFVGTVSLSTSVSPTGLTASLGTTSISLTSGGTGTSILTLSSSTSGTYSVAITATSGSLSHSTIVTVKVTDFTVFSPSSLTVITGASTTSTISLTSLNGFVGTVTLSTVVLPFGLTASINPANVTLAAGGTGTSVLTLSSTTVGTYTVTLTGTSGSLSHAVTVSVKVIAPPDFTVTANPATVTFPTGSTGTSTATVTSLNGFVGTLTVSRSVTPSTGLTASCTPTSVALTSGSWANSNCTFSSSTTGVYTVTISATNGTLTHSESMTVNVSDYSVSANPASQTILVTSSGTSTITVTSLNSFSGTVSLALTASGLTASLSQSSLSISPGGTATSILTLSSATIGNYTLTVTGTSGSLTRSVEVTIRVVDFSISTSSATLTIFAGQQGTSTITLNSLGGFTGSIALASVVSPSGLTSSMSPASVTLTSNGSGTSTLTVNSLTGGVYTVTVTGTSGGLSRTIQVTVNVLDFTISANPSTVSFHSGSNGTSTVTLTSLGGFAGNVTLSESATPTTGLSVACSSTSVSLTSGSSATSTCSFSSSTQGTYTVTITATSGSLSHTATVTVALGDFTISSSPIQVTIQAGRSATSTITLNSVSGFTGTINLSTSANPSGLTASVNPASVGLIPGGAASSTLTLSSSLAGTYTVTIVGSIGSVSHSVQVIVIVQDFSLSTDVGSLSLAPNTSGTVTINLASTNGFTGTVSLSAVCSPSSPKLGLSSSSVTLVSGGSGTDTLTVKALKKTPPGTYTITITATSGSLTHTVNLTLTIT